MTNSADLNGGGIDAISSTATLTNRSHTYFVDNSAKRRFGMSLGMNAKIYLLKMFAECELFDCNGIDPTTWLTLEFM